MFLQDKKSGSLVEIIEIEELFNPVSDTVRGRLQTGEEEQQPESINKKNLSFPSGEDLPVCWLDSDYRKKTKS